MRLRIKDVDFERHVIIVREAKGAKDRVVMLPRSLAPPLRLQMLAARAQWEADRQVQRGGVEVPHALESKYPKVGCTWGWFWMFPSLKLSVDPRSGVERRHHLFEERLQRALKKAVAAAGWVRRALWMPYLNLDRWVSAHNLTGIPRSRILCLACCTVYSP